MLRQLKNPEKSEKPQEQVSDCTSVIVSLSVAPTPRIRTGFRGKLSNRIAYVVVTTLNSQCTYNFKYLHE